MLKPQTEEFDVKARAIAAELYDDLRAQYHDTYLHETNFDYAYGETPVIDAWSDCFIECNKISKKQFDLYNKGLEAITPIEGDGFRVIVMLSDCGAYTYWRTQDDPLMIMVTAEITDIEKIDGNKLLDAFVTLGNVINNIVTGESL